MALTAILLNTFANPAVYLAPRFVSFAALPFRRHTSTVLGVAFSIAGLGLQFLSHLHLGKNWSSKIEAKKQDQLVTRGVYLWIRHPMYLVFLLSAAAYTFLSSNWLCGLSFWILVIATVRRMPAEEVMMKEKFGEVYESYYDRTPVLFPRLLRHISKVHK